MKNVQLLTLIEFDYVNWKGVSSKRLVQIYNFYFGSNEWHKEEQWLMKGLDKHKNETRVFAMKDMSNVKSVTK